ncbi:hypothetical protein ACFLZW_04640 [Chloroflexota bacterium]
MTNLLATLISASLSLFGYGIFVWGAIRLLGRKGLPKASISSLGIGTALLSIGLARSIVSTDGEVAVVLGVIFCIMALVARHWEKSGADWLPGERT